MRISSVYLCDYAFNANGKQSLIGIFEQFNLPQMPIKVPQFHIVFQMESDIGEEITIGARLADPKGRTLGEAGVEGLKIARGGSDIHKGWFQFGFMNLEFKEPGKHSIEIIAGKNKDVVHSIPLQVSWRKQKQL